MRWARPAAHALIAPPENVPIEQADKLFLVYLSFPADQDLAKKVPSGFYTIERMPDQPILRARVVNLEGKPVLELPLNIIKTEYSPEYASEYGWGKSNIPRKEPITSAQALIEQSQIPLYRDIVIQAHGIL